MLRFSLSGFFSGLQNLLGGGLQTLVWFNGTRKATEFNVVWCAAKVCSGPWQVQLLTDSSSTFSLESDPLRLVK